MKVIIAGSRSITDPKLLDRAIYDALGLKGINITEVVCGMAPGVDMLGWRWAKETNTPIKEMPAQWKRPDGTRDKYAGFKRNQEMAEYADAAILLWDGRSNGTYNMKCHIERVNKPFYLVRI